MNENPILNNPYLEPKSHYATDLDGALNYETVCKGRRIFTSDIQVMPNKQDAQSSMFEVNDAAGQYEAHIINLCRKEVGIWRKEDYPNTTRVTRELLLFWFKNEERRAVQKLFFAQQEAVETAIWLNEVANKSNQGNYILGLLQNAQKFVGDAPENQLPRIAFKMATGYRKDRCNGLLNFIPFF
jgi:type III restriction enzyme